MRFAAAGTGTGSVSRGVAGSSSPSKDCRRSTVFMNARAPPPSFQTRPPFNKPARAQARHGRLEQGKRCLGSNYRREVEATVLGNAAPDGLADVVEDRGGRVRASVSIFRRSSGERKTALSASPPPIARSDNGVLRASDLRWAVLTAWNASIQSIERASRVALRQWCCLH